MAKNRIKELRQHLGLTQQELSDSLSKKLVDIPRNTIARYESGIRNPSDKVLKEISNALDVPFSFLNGTGYDKDEIPEKIINDLHTAFFNIHEYNDQLREVVTRYLLLTGSYPRLLAFYQDSNNEFTPDAVEKHYPRNKEVDMFWQDQFPFLFTDDFIFSLIGTNDLELKMKLITKIWKELDAKTIDKNISQFLSNINQVHQNTIDKAYDKTRQLTLIPAIDEEIDFLKKARKELLNNGFFENKHTNYSEPK